MKVHALVATALAMPQDTVVSTTEKENFITSGVKFYLEMDSVMGGVSTAKLEHDDEQLYSVRLRTWDQLTNYKPV